MRASFDIVRRHRTLLWFPVMDAKLLFSGHVDSFAGKALLGAVLVCGFGVTVAANVVRQVFGVSLYRAVTASGTA